MRRILIAIFLLTATLAAEEAQMSEPAKTEKLTGKKVLILIASQNFRDEEFEAPFKTLKSAGAEVVVASSQKASATGMLGKKVTPDILHKDADPAAFDCVIFVGGAGAREYFHDQVALNIASKAASAGKLVAAICVAPVILANAGVLNGKKATCFPSVSSSLAEGGAKLEKGKVVQDGRIVTSPGPEAANEFAGAILAALEK